MSVPAPEIQLDRAPIGRPVILIGVADEERAMPGGGLRLADQLAAEGLVVGVVLVPERRLPLGGPVVVGVGRARVALARDIARQLVVRAAPDPTDLTPSENTS